MGQPLGTRMALAGCAWLNAVALWLSAYFWVVAGASIIALSFGLFEDDGAFLFSVAAVRVLTALGFGAAGLLLFLDIRLGRPLALVSAAAGTTVAAGFSGANTSASFEFAACWLSTMLSVHAMMIVAVVGSRRAGAARWEQLAEDE